MFLNKKAMKKQLLLAFFMLLGGVKVLAYERVNFVVEWSYVDPFPATEGPNRGPVVCPDVTQDGHTLYFNNVTYDLELVLVDEDGDEVYSVFVPANTASVVLPSSLNGDYELQLYPTDSSYYFYSDITL